MSDCDDQNNKKPIDNRSTVTATTAVISFKPIGDDGLIITTVTTAPAVILFGLRLAGVGQCRALLTSTSVTGSCLYLYGNKCNLMKKYLIQQMSSFDWKENIEDSIKDGLIITITTTGIFYALKAVNVKLLKASLYAMDIMNLPVE